MRCLWDTHALLWLYFGDTRISARARTLMTDASTENHVSGLSLWEIANKLSLGKLEFAQVDLLMLAERIKDDGITLLHVEPKDCQQLLFLPPVHRDPFDRMIAVQCQTRQLALISADSVFDQYGITRVW